MKKRLKKGDFPDSENGSASLLLCPVVLFAEDMDLLRQRQT